MIFDLSEDPEDQILLSQETLEFQGKTYDRCLSIHLDDNHIGDSWIILQSSQYGQMHTVKLRDCGSLMQK